MPAKRYCGMCDRWFGSKVRECPACGADTDKADIDHPSPVKVVDLMDALKKALDHVNATKGTSA